LSLAAVNAEFGRSRGAATCLLTWRVCRGKFNSHRGQKVRQRPTAHSPGRRP
jgi:hypothetical protein